MKRILSILIPFLILSGCSTSPKDRTIAFEGIENARELGGLQMQDGRRIRAGKLVRSAELSKASDADVALLKKRFGLTDVFDFRFEAERSKAMDREIDGVKNTWLSTLPENFVAAFASGRADTTVVQSQNLMEILSEYAFNPKAQQMAQELSSKGGALWHCSQGKDRCGWGSAFVLAALGASRETIVEDFALSNVSYASAVEAISAKIVEKGGGEAELSFIRAMIGVSVENFESTLDLIDSRYGSLQAYLEQALGFSAEEQESLKRKYLR